MKRLPALLAIIVLAACCFLSGKRGIADLYSLRPLGPLDERPVKRMADSDLANAFSSASLAHRLDPGNPLYLENMARIRYWQAGISPYPGKMKTLLGEALSYSKEAAGFDPVSPYPWSTMMLVKLKLGEIDADFGRFMNNAAMLGPWEPEIQRSVAKAGLLSWSRLSGSERKTVLEDFTRGYRRQAGKMTEIAMNCGNHGKTCD